MVLLNKELGQQQNTFSYKSLDTTFAGSHFILFYFFQSIKCAI